MNALTYENVSAFYGTSQILHGLSMEVAAGEATCLLGLNGMGKTTTLRATMGLVDRMEGEIRLNGALLTGPTHKRARRGVTLVPEDRKVFNNLTVRENLEVAVREAEGTGFSLADVEGMFPRLAERGAQKGGTLSGGEQQMLVVARALLANPAYIMLDEPTEGLAPTYVAAIGKAIEVARGHGIGIILVEQSLPLAQAVGDRFHIMENGSIVSSFTRAEVQADPGCLAALLTVE